MNSKKLRSLLEIVLAFGNYLNSGKRGPAYGFKLQSLDALIDAKSGDRRQCLLHFIIETIHKKMPQIANFDDELRFVEKAATGESSTVKTIYVLRNCNVSFIPFFSFVRKCLK
jgi:hypothetical protein